MDGTCLHHQRVSIHQYRLDVNRRVSYGEMVVVEKALVERQSAVYGRDCLN